MRNNSHAHTFDFAGRLIAPGSFFHDHDGPDLAATVSLPQVGSLAARVAAEFATSTDVETAIALIQQSPFVEENIELLTAVIEGDPRESVRAAAQARLDELRAFLARAEQEGETSPEGSPTAAAPLDPPGEPASPHVPNAPPTTGEGANGDAPKLPLSAEAIAALGAREAVAAVAAHTDPAVLQALTQDTRATVAKAATDRLAALASA